MIHDPILRFTIPPTSHDPTWDLDFDNLGWSCSVNYKNKKYYNKKIKIWTQCGAGPPWAPPGSVPG